MSNINVTVTRKWIKDLRAEGKSNIEIIDAGMKRAYLCKYECVEDATVERLEIFKDLRLAGLIADD